jgi:hypothetical protein
MVFTAGLNNDKVNGKPRPFYSRSKILMEDSNNIDTHPYPRHVGLHWSVHRLPGQGEEEDVELSSQLTITVIQCGCHNFHLSDLHPRNIGDPPAAPNSLGGIGVEFWI